MVQAAATAAEVAAADAELAQAPAELQKLKEELETLVGKKHKYRRKEVNRDSCKLSDEDEQAKTSILRASTALVSMFFPPRG